MVKPAMTERKMELLSNLDISAAQEKPFFILINLNLIKFHKNKMK